MDTTLKGLLARGRAIWGDDRLPLEKIVIRLGVSYGDLCRGARNSEKDAVARSDAELKKELGNVIFSAVRWCDDLGYDPEECVAIAAAAQEKFATENAHR